MEKLYSSEQIRVMFTSPRESQFVGKPPDDDQMKLIWSYYTFKLYTRRFDLNAVESPDRWPDPQQAKTTRFLREELTRSENALDNPRLVAQIEKDVDAIFQRPGEQDWHFGIERTKLKE